MSLSTAEIARLEAELADAKRKEAQLQAKVAEMEKEELSASKARRNLMQQIHDLQESKTFLELELRAASMENTS